MQTTYVSELIIWTRTRACCTPSCRYTRCLRCSSWSGTLPRDKFSNSNRRKLPSTWRHVRVSFQIIKSDQIFTIVNLQFKTGVKSTLTSQIKELDAINTFGIKNWLNLNLDWSRLTNTINIDWLASMAMRMPSDLRSSGLGSVHWRKRMKIGNEWFSQELEQMRKESRFSLC